MTATRGGVRGRRSGVRRRSVAALVLLAGAGLGAVACRSAAPPAATPPYNLLLVSLDTVRRDVLGCYGHRPVHASTLSTSPTLDRLASEGVRMADAYATSSWTLPSHLSIMTGLPALAHGVDTEGASLDRAVPTLAEVLKARGYQTSGIYSAPYLDPYWGFDRGFDRYVPVYGAVTLAASQRIAALRADIERAAGAGDWRRYDELKQEQAQREGELNDRSQEVVSSREVSAAAAAEIARLTPTGNPWFVFAHFFDAHCDYAPPPPYDTLFDPTYAGAFTGRGCMGGPAVGTPDPEHPGGLLRTIGQRDLEHAFALYEGEVAWVDNQLGAILDALDTAGAARRTLVVVVADHGEEFFEHGGLGHRRTLNEEVVRTPMLLRLPGVLPASVTVPGPLSGADLFPTILELLGVPNAPTPGAASFVDAIRAGKADHEVMMRTAIMFGGTVRVDAGGDVLLRQVVVHDGYRRGRIKITRTRSWPQFQADVASDVQTILATEAAAQYTREQLRWIDVERFPDEPDTRQSSDFSDPDARAVLDAFRNEYRTLAAQRTERPQTSAIPHNIRRALESLGYIEHAGGPAFPEPDLLLPPP